MFIPEGFSFGAIASGIKKKGFDLGLIYAEKPALGVGVFTTNLVKAAPVLLGQEVLTRNNKFRAIIVNSGCANACTGEAGLLDAKEISSYLAQKLNCSPEEILPASTGVIGERLPKEKIIKAIPSLIEKLSPERYQDFAKAIMTTDAFPKIASRQIEISGVKINILGIAKGAGMIAPNMATMLAFLLTDISLPQERLAKILKAVVNKTFNRITVDGDTSTNDTVYLMASGQKKEVEKKDMTTFEKALYEVCYELASFIVKDGEGATKLVKISVTNAKSEEKALKMAKTIANSLLVKTALFGEDPNWGRFLAAMGRAGVNFDPNKVDIYVNKIKIVENGLGIGKENENKAHLEMKKPNFSITIDLKEGDYKAYYLTCDLSYDYVKINAEYRT
ncbi:arginine biosynthesis bifunctional protein ArgJ [Thermodesulfatator indicus DSM 15286]|uniref:Arginine biosynthesis bifunctional protein ArgJ n=1 Tax=Thermodesulfatator indicus (strain DSM 15286 / JCM 11887 / CIR29812) TaxID=667014 RepID=F8ACE5_THEID|nr:bifunctional glutamate N-acetyltransferase/amino-acid acetyltransferase ArgJ [Thermodesulfatator indicus]AEH44646.1 arginine biosynthesis bifunctional protein ArgJ [Thermodesulfatator indicus DSM 15286]